MIILFKEVNFQVPVVDFSRGSWLVDWEFWKLIGLSDKWVIAQGDNMDYDILHDIVDFLSTLGFVVLGMICFYAVFF